MNMMEKNVIVFGDNCVDFNIKIKENSFNFLSDSNHHVDRLIIRPGGTGINYSVALSNFGANVYYYGSLSKDFFGKLILKHLKRYKVKLELISYTNKKTAKIIILTNRKGERITFANLKDASYLQIDFNLMNNFDLDKIDCVYISGGILTENSFNELFFKFVKDKFVNKKIFFDFNYRIGKGIKGFKKFAYKFMDISDIIFTNLFEFNSLERKFLNKLLIHDKILVLKMGENGVKLIKKEQEIKLDGIKVKSVDTVGTGDIFNALFTYKYLNTNNLKESLEFANYYAALSTTKFGFFIPNINKEKEEKC